VVLSMISKGVIIVLLFTGGLEMRPFDYTASLDSSPDERVMACSRQADSHRNLIATHRWDDPRGHGYYLNDGTGTVIGSIC
jgi:hypothetical protein